MTRYPQPIFIKMPNQAGELIRDRRKELKLTQAQVARFLGLSQNRYSMLAQNIGEMSLERFITLANYLQFDLTMRDREETPDWIVQD